MLSLQISKNSDTIVALSSGLGAISIVRVSGIESLNIAKNITQCELKPRYAHLCKLTLNESFLDEAIVIYFKAPFSYTGEDIVEFQCHGGEAIASILINYIIENFHTRVADAGEFTKRAFLNGKIDLSKAEAIAKIIETKSEAGAKILAKNLKGDLAKFIDEIRARFLNILAHIEVSIDYAEDDLPQNILDELTNSLNESIESLERLLAGSKQRESIFSGFRVSIVGKPNVGKSSILNSLLNYDRAIVSDIAGTTRDTIEESIKIDSHIIKIVDTAGIRENTLDLVEKIGIEKSIQAIEESEIVIALFDNSREFDCEDKKMLQLLNNYKYSKKLIVALNKSDLESKFDLTKLKDFLTIKSSKDDTSNLITSLSSILKSFEPNSDEFILSSKREMLAIQKAIESMKLAKENFELELISFELQNAVTSLSQISRPIEYNELLDEIFGNFCLGK